MNPLAYLQHNGNSSHLNLQVAASNTDMSEKWKAADIPSLTGKRVIITGANSGIGLGTAKKIAAEGGRAIIIGRNPDTLAQAKAFMSSMSKGDRGVGQVLADTARQLFGAATG